MTVPFTLLGRESFPISFCHTDEWPQRFCRGHTPIELGMIVWRGDLSATLQVRWFSYEGKFAQSTVSRGNGLTRFKVCTPYSFGSGGSVTVVVIVVVVVLVTAWELLAVLSRRREVPLAPLFHSLSHAPPLQHYPGRLLQLGHSQQISTSSPHSLQPSARATLTLISWAATTHWLLCIVAKDSRSFNLKCKLLSCVSLPENLRILSIDQSQFDHGKSQTRL